MFCFITLYNFWTEIFWRIHWFEPVRLLYEWEALHHSWSGFPTVDHSEGGCCRNFLPSPAVQYDLRKMWRMWRMLHFKRGGGFTRECTHDLNYHLNSKHEPGFQISQKNARYGLLHCLSSLPTPDHLSNFSLSLHRLLFSQTWGWDGIGLDWMGLSHQNTMTDTQS